MPSASSNELLFVLLILFLSLIVVFQVHVELSSIESDAAFRKSGQLAERPTSDAPTFSSSSFSLSSSTERSSPSSSIFSSDAASEERAESISSAPLFTSPPSSTANASPRRATSSAVSRNATTPRTSGKRDQIIILGMHHSGTSLLMQSMLTMGLYGGLLSEFELQKNAVPPDSWPAKWWERKDIVNLNLMLMEPFLDQRDKWKAGFHYGGLNRLMLTDRRVFEHRASKVLKRLNEHRPWVIKEPRLSITLGNAWRSLPELDAPMCVILYRHPQMVAMGILRHWPNVNRQFSAEEWLGLWEKYTASALRACRGLPTAFVSHELLTLDPWLAISLLVKQLEVLGVPLELRSSVSRSLQKKTGQRPFTRGQIRAIFNGTFYHPRHKDFPTVMTIEQYELFATLDKGLLSSSLGELGHGARESLAPLLAKARESIQSWGFYNSEKEESDNDGSTVDDSWYSGVTPSLKFDSRTVQVALRSHDEVDFVGSPEDDPVSTEQELEPEYPVDYKPWWSPFSSRLLLNRVNDKLAGNGGVTKKPTIPKRAPAAPGADGAVSLLQRSLLSSGDDDGRRSPDSDGSTFFRSFLSANSFQSACLSTRPTVLAVYGNTAFSSLIRNWICHIKRVLQPNHRFVVFALDEQLCPLLSAQFPDVPCFFDVQWWQSQQQQQASSAQYSVKDSPELVPVGDNPPPLDSLSGHARWKDTASSSSSSSLLPSKRRYFLMLLFKMHYARVVVGQGYDLLLSDADTVFLKDPFCSLFSGACCPIKSEATKQKDALNLLRKRPVLEFASSPVDERISKINLIIQSDSRANDDSSRDWICAGNFWLRGDSQSALMIETVIELMVKTSISDQDALQYLLTNATQTERAASSAIEAVLSSGDHRKVQRTRAMLQSWRTLVLDPLAYPNGGGYFVDELPQRLGVTVQFVHANMNWDKETTLRKHNLWYEKC